MHAPLTPRRRERAPQADAPAAAREIVAPASGAGEASGEADAHDTSKAERGRRFHCGACDAHVADSRDLFAAAGAGASAVFVNPSGRFFEIVTLRRVRSVATAGPLTYEATWFDGFAWQLALCARCGSHLGWRYRAAGGAKPGDFFGLIRAALVERDG